MVSAPSIMLRLGDMWVNALDIVTVATSLPSFALKITLRGRDDVITLYPVRQQGAADVELAAHAAKLIEDIEHATRVYSGKVEYAPPKFKPSGN